MARDRRRERPRPKAAQAATSLERKRAANAYGAGRIAPAAIMSPMFAGKHKSTVIKFTQPNRAAARNEPSVRALEVIELMKVDSDANWPDLKAYTTAPTVAAAIRRRTGGLFLDDGVDLS